MQQVLFANPTSDSERANILRLANKDDDIAGDITRNIFFVGFKREVMQSMIDINQNIKLVFLEKEVAEESVINALENAGAEVVVTDREQLSDELSKTDIHIFNCCAVGGRTFVQEARDNHVRAVETDKSKLMQLDAEYFVECGRLERYELCEDAFIENEPDSEDVGHLESVFALGNGYLGMRGTYDERNEGFHEIPGMYINGIFEREPLEHLWSCKGFAKNEQYTVNLCDWRMIELFVNGEKATVINGISNHRRILDFKKGEIVRTFCFTSSDGKKVSVESVRIVSNSRVHSAAIKYTVTALNFDGEIELHSCVVKNTETNGKMPTKTVYESADNGVLVLETKTKRTEQSIAAAIAHKTVAETYIEEECNSEREYEYIVKAKLKCGDCVSIEKYAAFYSSEDNRSELCTLAEEEVGENVRLGFSAFREQQHAFWKKHWETGDVVIEGNLDDCRAVRFSLFHLKSQLPTINYASIGATGLTGENYSGKVFWDTEMYLMPYYLFTTPEKCRDLIMYRVKLLDKARERAKELGAQGAIYSWCSIDGEETSVVFEASTAELHINSDIAYAVWRYEKVTEDSAFVYENCAEMLFETARYYAHRGSFSEAYDGRFCLNAVCGPDEYACGVNNNCYTNFMVRFHLRYALEVYDRMKQQAPQKLREIIERVQADEEELALWKKAADRIYYRVNEKYGVYEQDSHFVYNDAVDMSRIPNNLDLRSCLHPLDLWRIQVLKQADVVLLQFVLGDLFTVEEKKQNYNYYAPRTNHGSSLSAAIHSIMANEIGYYEDAYEYFRSAAYMDISDFKRNTTGGLHMACLGGVWMSVVNGFVGMRLYADGLHFSPGLPESWKSCTLNMRYGSSLINICVRKNDTSFTLVEGDSIQFKVNGREVCLTKDNKTVKTENCYENKSGNI